MTSVLYYLKFKFSLCQQGLTKPRSTDTISIAYVEFTPPIFDVCVTVHL